MNRHAKWSRSIGMESYRTEWPDQCHYPEDKRCCGVPNCEDCDSDPSDATNPYAKPYDEALAGHINSADVMEIPSSVWRILVRPPNAD